MQVSPDRTDFRVRRESPVLMEQTVLREYKEWLDQRVRREKSVIPVNKVNRDSLDKRVSTIDIEVSIVGSLYVK